MLIRVAYVLCFLQRFLGMSGLCRLERKLLGALSGQLPGDAARILRSQLLLTNRVLRFPRISNEVYLYQAAWAKVPHFPAQYIERTFATVSFGIDKSPGEAFRARFVNVRGALFAIVYSKHPSWKARHFGEPIIEKVKIHYDVMTEVHETMEDWERKRKAKVGRLTGWLGEWQEKHTVREMSKPASKKPRRERFKELGVVPPADYLELLDQVDGMTIGGVSILGAEEVYEVELPEGTYVLVAEAHTPEADVFHLLLKAGAGDGQIYRCHHEDLECVACGASLRETVEPFLTAEACDAVGDGATRDGTD